MAHKSPLPFLPRRLALITSPTGAAVRDFLRVLKGRFPFVQVLIYPVKVQGPEAAGRSSRPSTDLPLSRRGGHCPGPGRRLAGGPVALQRGGGGPGHLPLPPAGGLGRGARGGFYHQRFCGGRARPTPSATVELVVPDRLELERRLERVGASLYRAWRRHLDAERRHLVAVARRLPNLSRRVTELRLRLDDKAETLSRWLVSYRASFAQRLQLARSRLLLLSPGRRVKELRQHLDQLGPRLTLGFCRCQETRRRHLTYCESHLANLDPMAILARGYAVATRVPEGPSSGMRPPCLQEPASG